MAQQMTDLPRLTSQQEFDAFRARAIEKWEAIWSGEKTIVSVGVGSSSIPMGALDVLAAFEAIAEKSNLHVRKTGIDGADWTDVQVRVKRKDAPAVVYANVVASDARGIIDGKHRSKIIGVEGDEEYDGHKPLNSHPFYKHQQRYLLRDVGVIDPESLEEAIARGAYMGLYKALFEMSQEEVIAEVTTANVRGRGGAGFPAGIKWESGRKARGAEKFVVCNSHEGEPNVYKDRRLLEGDPHRVIEGILIACIAVGAERGYNYIGGEHPMAIKRSRKAVEDATALGLIGRNILGSGKNVAFRLRTGGGAYICGEGSALMYSVMGVRGQPRTKPPRSVEEGLWKRPTVANNTETLANIRDIVVKGGEWYASIGTERSKGTKLMTVQGPVKTMGLVEVPMGINFKLLVDEIWGGMRDGYTFKGIQTGGVSAGPLRYDQLDVPVDFDSLTAMGGMLGSGGFVVFDDSVCVVDFARYMTAFSRVESCSKCVPCARGNPALVEVVDRIRFGRGSQTDLPLLHRTSTHVIELSLCGLGQVAPMPLLGMMKEFPDEFQAHIDGVCPCGVCPVSAEATVQAIAAD